MQPHVNNGLTDAKNFTSICTQ